MPAPAILPGAQASPPTRLAPVGAALALPYNAARCLAQTGTIKEMRRMARKRARSRKRSRNENIMIVVGILVSISMVISGFAYMMQ